MATHSSILVWKIPWTEEPDGLQSMGLQKSRTQLRDLTTFLLYLITGQMWVLINMTFFFHGYDHDSNFYYNF